MARMAEKTAEGHQTNPYLKAFLNPPAPTHMQAHLVGLCKFPRLSFVFSSCRRNTGDPFLLLSKIQVLENQPVSELVTVSRPLLRGSV